MIQLLPYLCGIYIPLLIAVSTIIVTGDAKERGLKSDRIFLAAVLFILTVSAVPLIILRLAYPEDMIKGFILRLSDKSFVCQDILKLCLFEVLYTVLALITAFLFRGIVYEGRSFLSRLQESLLIAQLMAAALLWVAGQSFAEDILKDLKIKEVHGDSSTVLLGEALTREDFVCLQSHADIPVSLDGLYLSDDETDLKKLSLTDERIAPHDEAFFFFNDRSPFKIGTGETIFLSDERGRILDSFIYALTPLPDAPVFSRESGYYEDEFLLELSVSENDDAVIRYTLDGSAPDINSELYTQPVRVYDRSGEYCKCRAEKRVVTDYAEYEPENTTVDRAFVIRAAAFDADGTRSKIANGVYFTGESRYKDRKVLLLNTDYDLLFGDNGICVTGPLYDMWYLGGQEGSEPYVNYRMSGREWERQANLQILDKGEYLGGQDVGIRVFGGGTREQPLKHFSIYSRKEYSSFDSFSMDIMGNGRPVHSVFLKDSVSDAVIHDLVRDRDVATEEHTEASVFLNGEFWYDTFIFEKYSSYYYYEHKGIPENNVVVFKDGLPDEAAEGDELLYQAIYGYISEHDLSDSVSYAEFGNIIDIQSYIDYMLINAYFCNLDQDELKNRILYRARIPSGEGENDGRWRFAIYDMNALEWVTDDPALYDASEPAAINPFTSRTSDDSPSMEEQSLFKALKQSPEFQKRFTETFEEMLKTDLSRERIKEVLERYGLDMSWKDHYFEKRAGFMRRFIREEFDQ